MSDWDYIEISPLKNGTKLFGELVKDDQESEVYKIVVPENLLTIELVHRPQGDIACSFLRSRGRGLIRGCFFIQKPDESGGIILHLHFQSIVSEIFDHNVKFRSFNYASDSFYRAIRGFWNPTSAGGTRSKQVITYSLRSIAEKKTSGRDYRLTIHPTFPWTLWPDVKGRLIIWDRPFLQFVSPKAFNLDHVERRLWALDNLFAIIAGEYVVNSSAALRYYRLPPKGSSKRKNANPLLVTYRAWNPPKLNVLYGGPLLHITEPQELFSIIRSFLERFDELENVISLYRVSKFITYKELSLLYNLFLIDTLFEKGRIAAAKPTRVLDDNEFEGSKSKILTAIKRDLAAPTAQKYWLDRITSLPNGYGFKRRLDTLLSKISSLITLPDAVRKDASKFRDSFAHGDILPKGISEQKAMHLAVVFEYVTDCIVFKELGISDDCIRNSHNLNARRHTVKDILHDYS